MSKHKLINYELLNNQELYFYYWLEELYKNGYIDYIEKNQQTFDLNDDVVFNWNKQLKTKIKPMSFNLIKQRNYTPDFIFNFTKKAEGIFYFTEETPLSKRLYFPMVNPNNKVLVDTKGEFTRIYTSSITFGDRQAIMWNRHDLYVQIVKAYIREGKKCLFQETFTPAKVRYAEVYKRNDKKRKIKKGDSKIKYEIRTLNQYIKLMSNE